jgi:hypothetical protein
LYNLVAPAATATAVAASAAAISTATATATVTAATAAATAAAITAAAAAVTTTAAAASACSLWARLIHNERSTANCFTVDCRDCLLRFVLGCKFDEPKSAGLTTVAVGNDLRRRDVTGLCEEFLKVLICGLIGQISYV